MTAIYISLGGALVGLSIVVGLRIGYDIGRNNSITFPSLTSRQPKITVNHLEPEDEQTPPTQ